MCVCVCVCACMRVVKGGSGVVGDPGFRGMDGEPGAPGLTGKRVRNLEKVCLFNKKLQCSYN